MKVVVFGAGQLAQMMYLESAQLGIDLMAVDVKSESLVHPVSKQPLNTKLSSAFEDAKVITAEFEHVPEHLLELADKSKKFRPNVQSILTGADRVREKKLLDKCGIPNAKYLIIRQAEDLDKCLDALGDRIIFKTSRDGYDGYGQWRIDSEKGLDELKTVIRDIDLTKNPLIAEQMLSFERELSIIGARNESGEICCYELAENLHHKGQLHVSVAPAQRVTDSLREKAREIFESLATELDYIGVLAVELFQIGDTLLVNEIAPRVHNSGHWTQNGAETSQFEQHIRAVLDFPLGDTECNKVTAMVNIIGCTSFSRDLISIPGCHLHWYGKELRESRKMGHINVTAKNYVELGEKLASLQSFLPTEYFPLLANEAKRLQET